MIDALLHALSPTLLLVSAGGVVLGIFWGALPGLSTTMAMMLLIGLSAGLSLDVALAFMLGVYNGSSFGGSLVRSTSVVIRGAHQYSGHAGFHPDDDGRLSSRQTGQRR